MLRVKSFFKSWNLHRTNNVLLAAIILINLYVILAPLYPAVVFWYQKDHGRTSQLSQLINPSQGFSSSKIPNQNSLVVPSMALNTPILEGPIYQEYTILDNGVWRWPNGSTPDKGGNTVLIGHRFTYTQPRGIFYELPRVKVGDLIGVFWKKKEYLYKVFKVSTVPPNDVSILNATTQPELTLYTCTPIWNPIHRFVVVAKLISTRS